jgi:hypothetical protein
MRITALDIRKRASYEESAGQLVGTVTLEGITGKQEIVLSPSAMSQIFAVIGSEVIERSRNNAAMVKAAVDEAVHAPLLAEAATIKIENDPS